MDRGHPVTKKAKYEPPEPTIACPVPGCEPKTLRSSHANIKHWAATHVKLVRYFLCPFRDQTHCLYKATNQFNMQRHVSHMHKEACPTYEEARKMSSKHKLKVGEFVNYDSYIKPGFITPPMNMHVFYASERLTPVSIRVVTREDLPGWEDVDAPDGEGSGREDEERPGGACWPAEPSPCPVPGCDAREHRTLTQQLKHWATAHVRWLHHFLCPFRDLESCTYSSKSRGNLGRHITNKHKDICPTEEVVKKCKHRRNLQVGMLINRNFVDPGHVRPPQDMLVFYARKGLSPIDIRVESPTPGPGTQDSCTIRKEESVVAMGSVNPASADSVGEDVQDEEDGEPWKPDEDQDALQQAMAWILVYRRALESEGEHLGAALVEKEGTRAGLQARCSQLKAEQSGRRQGEPPAKKRR